MEALLLEVSSDAASPSLRMSKVRMDEWPNMLKDVVKIKVKEFMSNGEKVQ